MNEVAIVVNVILHTEEVVLTIVQLLEMVVISAFVLAVIMCPQITPKCVKTLMSVQHSDTIVLNSVPIRRALIAVHADLISLCMKRNVWPKVPKPSCWLQMVSIFVLSIMLNSINLHSLLAKVEFKRSTMIKLLVSLSSLLEQSIFSYLS